jgi:hypothetical protein
MVAGGTIAPVLTEADVHTRRLLAVEYLEWACGWPPDKDVPISHPVYQRVVEGRRYELTPPSSSCGDLAHAMLFHAGVRTPTINRDEHRGWMLGVNVSRLSWPPAPVVDYHGQPLEGGDIVVIWNKAKGTDAHVVCVINTRAGAEFRCLDTAEYGQPGGALKTYPTWNGTHIGRRKIQKYLSFEAVLRDAFVRGLLVDPRPLSCNSTTA